MSRPILRSSVCWPPQSTTRGTPSSSRSASRPPRQSHHEYGEESALGNLFADMMLAATSGADVALTNGGGLRPTCPKGPLTFGDLSEAMPFDNYMVRLRLTGQELARVLAGNLGAGGGILSVAGAE